jgi:hypothetical protein
VPEAQGLDDVISQEGRVVFNLPAAARAMANTGNSEWRPSQSEGGDLEADQFALLKAIALFGTLENPDREVYVDWAVFRHALEENMTQGDRAAYDNAEGPRTFNFSQKRRDYIRTWTATRGGPSAMWETLFPPRRA